MKHLVVVLVDTDTQYPKVKISHHKAIVFDPNNREEMEKLIANDINTLLTGLIFAIRKGGDEGILNKVATIENAISYLRNSVSSIELVQEVHSGLLDPKAMENIVR